MALAPREKKAGRVFLYQYILVKLIMILVFPADLFLSAGRHNWTWEEVISLPLAASMIILTIPLWQINPAPLAGQSQTQARIQKWGRPH